MEFRMTTSLTLAEREQWDRFVQECPYSRWNQSYDWGQFQEALTGRDVFYLIGSQDGKWRGCAQIFRRSWPWPLNHLGNYEISSGPSFLSFRDLQEILLHLDDWAKRRAVQLSIGPRCLIEDYKSLAGVCTGLGYVPAADATAAIYGEETILVDLRPTREEIFKPIRYTTRYEIRRAERLGVKVRFSNDVEAIKTFYDIHRKQDVLKEIAPIDERFFILLHKHFLSNTKNGVIAIAELEGRPLSAAICYSFGRVARYQWGASDELQEKRMTAAHLLHWEMIRHFKEAGCEWYDFSGASPILPRNYFSYGVNVFKTGFSKKFVRYTPDFVKRYRPLLCAALDWRSSVQSLWRRVLGLRPFRFVASIRNRLDAEMSTVVIEPSNNKFSIWSRLPRVMRMSLAVSILFLLSVGYVSWSHEIWRGEMRPWVMARDSSSTRALLNQIRNEGASPMWPLCLRVLSRLNLNPVSMQILNVFLGTVLIFVFWLQAPFSPFQKILLTFNYYLFYQYTVVSSNYLLSLLFLALACVFYETRRTNPYRLAGVLFLACMTSRNAMLLGLGMSSAFLWDAMETQDRRRNVSLTAMGIFAASIFLTGISMRPVIGVPYLSEWYLHLNIYRLLWLADTYAKAFLAFPVPGRPYLYLFHLEHFLLASRWILVVAAALFLQFASMVRLRKDALIAFVVSTGGLLIFFYAGFLGIYRHAGFLFFSLLFAWWLNRSENRWTERPRFWPDTLLSGVLIVQMVGGMASAMVDIRQPISGGRAAAQYISQRGFAETLISVTSASLGTPLSGYLDLPLYYPEEQEWTSHAPWNYQEVSKLSDEELIKRTDQEAYVRRLDVLLILNHPLAKGLQKVYQLELLRAFTGSVVADENYYLYFHRT